MQKWRRRPAIAIQDMLPAVVAFIMIALVGTIGALILQNFQTTASAQSTLTATAAGGIAPYTYQWSTGSSCSATISGQTGQTYHFTNSGVYSVLVTDSASDTSCASVTV